MNAKTATTAAIATGSDKGSLDPTPAPFATSGSEGVAAIVTTLQKVYDRIQKRTPGLPDATIVVNRSSRAWGHTSTAKTWGAQTTKGRGKAKTVGLKAERYEIMISGENLSRGAESVMGTLLHEATHAWNLAQGIQDVDVNGRHTKGAFAGKAGDLFGLEIRDMGTYIGWSDTYLTDATRKAYAVEIKMVAAALTKSTVAHMVRPGDTITIPGGGTKVVGPKGGTGRAKNLSRAVCDCAPDASGWRPSLRASAKVLAIGIKCEACGGTFRVTGE
jgi:hypothetical protein